MFKEHEQIVLTHGVLGDDGRELKPGEVGTVVHVHPDPGAEGFVAEFMTHDGETTTVATVLRSQARPNRIGAASERAT